MKVLLRSRARIVLSFGIMLATSLPLAAQQVPDLSAAVRLRDIGPTRQGGRYVEFAVVESRPQVYYAATGSGGLWKTENHGLSWTPIFDDRPVISIGAVAVAQSDPNVVYVGTGEANSSRSTYWGDGIYRSSDAGRTWRNVGLPNSGHIGRIVVHPTNPDLVYVAALGHLYSHNAERGLYMTTDGGATWTKTLDHRVDGREIGVVDVAMDPSNPQLLYAATYDKVRRPWTFGEGGPGSGIHRSTDGGRTWTKLTNGLPEGLLGRIGIGIARSAPNTVYAIVENANSRTGDAQERHRRMVEGFGGGSIGDQLYRSDDAGLTWRLVAPTPTPVVAQAGARGAADGPGGGGGARSFGGSPPYYYGQVRVDPNDPEHLYVLSVAVTHSTDGGRTWSRPFAFGGDNHALWINPRDSQHMLLGYDHGMGITFDGGRNWYHPDNVPLAQFYAVGYDMEVPYNVYGGLQDNGSVKGPSTRRGGGAIEFEDWYRVGGGDGMHNVVDPNDSRWLYNESQFGNIQRVDQLTGETKSIRYRRPEGSPPLRWNWDAPILISPHDSDVIYHGAQVLLRSPFRGESWEEISPDLTVNDPARQGGSGNIQYATITTVDESPIVPGVIWVGTDDGNVQLTQDGGKNWTNLRNRINGHPGYWVSRVIASHHNPAVAYVTVTGYRHDDFRPFVWRTTDYGQSWTSIAANLPAEPVNVIREDRENPNLLFVGTELGLYTSIDGGRGWTRLKNGMPTNPVHDVQIHPRDDEVIVATHGRGIFIGDVSPLQELTPAVLAADAHLFDVQPAVQWIAGQRANTASTNYSGESRPTGVLINYYLRRPVSGDVKIRVFDGARLLAEVDAPKTAGIHTVRWTMQARRERTAAEAAARAAGGGGGFGGGGGPGGQGAQSELLSFPTGGQGIVLSTVPPGDYDVVLSVAGREYREKAIIHADHWFRR
jgi:photosystem II stability/assembly factor-like uncharacterized protein